MTDATADFAKASKNVALYPWYQFFQGLIFWQATWFLYFQNQLSAAEAILLYAIYDIGTTALEVPSGYMSDKIGRRFTLITSVACGLIGMILLAFGSGFAVLALAQVMLGARAAFASGTDNALLYESLLAAGRQDEIEQQELKAWRYLFIALAVSAVIGGALALYLDILPFLAAAAALAGALVITLKFQEPSLTKADIETDTKISIPQGAEIVRLTSLKNALTEPVLIWLFVLSLLMYGFSHIPFVFGQPFILEALQETGYEAEAPLVSGVVTALMMMLSVVTSLFALRFRNWLGLPGILLLAFGMQIALTGVLAVTNDVIAIALLFLRMVPDSLSKPFILSRIQPLLNSESRATYLSLQSFCGRLFFAATLFLASLSTSGDAQMSYPEIQQILGWYVLLGLVFLGGLAMFSGRLNIDNRAKE